MSQEADLDLKELSLVNVPYDNINEILDNEDYQEILDYAEIKQQEDQCDIKDELYTEMFNDNDDNDKLTVKELAQKYADAKMQNIKNHKNHPVDTTYCDADPNETLNDSDINERAKKYLDAKMQNITNHKERPTDDTPSTRDVKSECFVMENVKTNQKGESVYIQHVETLVINIYQ